MGELTDAEFWLLLSLDAEARLFELLMAITQHMDGDERQIRPSLSIPEAAQALASLAARGFVEFREERSDASIPDGWRLVPQDRVQAIFSEPSNWEVPTDDGKVSYWAAATDEGEAAYRRESEARGSAWVE